MWLTAACPAPHLGTGPWRPHRPKAALPEAGRVPSHGLCGVWRVALEVAVGFSHSWAAPMSPRSNGVETWPLTVKLTMRYGTRTLLCPDGTFNTICVPLGSSTNVTTREIRATPKTMPTRIDLEMAISTWSRKAFRADTDGSVTISGGAPSMRRDVPARVKTRRRKPTLSLTRPTVAHAARLLVRGRRW